MDRFRNMEAVLMLLFCGACAGAAALDRPATPRTAAMPQLAGDGILVAPMVTIVITGKRWTMAQKQAADKAEAQAALAATAAAGRAG